MSGSLNKVMLIGHLGKDPEMRFTPSGKAVTNFTMATNEVWLDQSGEKQERTEWHRVVTWGKLAENCAKLLSKGKQIYIEGRIQTRQWDDKDGNKRYTTEIVANQMQLLSAMDSQGPRTSAASEDPGYGASENVPNSPEFDDIPF